MSSDVPSISPLEPGVPKIVITEPSPMPVANTVGRVPDNVPLPVTSTEPPTTSQVQTTLVSESPSGHLEETVTPVPEKTAVGTSGEFRPVGDCAICVVKVEDSNSTADTADAENEASGDFPETRTFYDGLIDCYRNWVGALQKSKYVLLIQIVFLAIPISAGYMGSVYMNKCPMSEATPFFLFMMGITGCIVILCRMLMLLKNVYVSDQNYTDMLSTITIFGNVAIVLFLCTEMVSFMRLSPSFQPGESNYCNRYFYKYTYWMNWCGLFFMILMAVMCAPKKCNRVGFQTEPTP